MNKFYNSKVQKVSVIVESPISCMLKECDCLSNMMRFVSISLIEAKQRDNDANEVQKHLQLYDLKMGEYITDKYAIWMGFRMISENTLYRMGRRIGSVGGRITLHIEKKAEVAEELKAYIYLVMDAQLTFRLEHSLLPCTRKMLHMVEPYTALLLVFEAVQG